MTQYFLDLRDARGIVRDEEGAEFSTLEEALDEAKASAKDLIKQYLDNGVALDEPASKSAISKAALWQF